MPKLDANPRVAFFRLFIKRWLFAASVVFSAYNPSGYSWFHWVTQTEGMLALKYFAGLAILIPAVAISRMAFLSIGLIGTATLALFVVAVILLLAGLDFVHFAHVEVTSYFLLFWLSFILAAGMGWSFVQRRISGERDVIRFP